MGKAELSQRFDLFIGGQWDELHQEAMRDAIPSRSHPVGAPTVEKKARMACQKVRIGEVSRARQCFTGASVAPGTDDTFRELQDRRPQVQRRELLREVLEFVPERLVDLDRKTFFDSLRSAPRGSSAGPGGCTYEHLKLMLDDTDSQELLLATWNLLAQGKVPVIGTALMGARLTALTKPNGGVREIATGCRCVGSSQERWPNSS